MDASFEWHDERHWDWQQPWLAPLARCGEPALAAIAAGATVAAACNAVRLARDGVLAMGNHCPAADTARAHVPANARSASRSPEPHFVPAAARPGAEAYEAFISRTGLVPTRDNAHDFLNALMWLHRPVHKARLNALQAAELARHGVARQRGALRDALTLFDENGAVLHAPARLVEALRRRDWQALFITHRAAWRHARFEVFGHALLEKLATAPRTALTAHVLLVDALDLSAADWAGKPFCPMPVLGVPGWCAANENSAFYDDPAVFRSPSASINR